MRLKSRAFRRPARRLFFAALAVCTLLTCAGGAGAQTGSRRAPAAAGGPTAFFVVSSPEGGTEGSMDALVLVEGGRFKALGGEELAASKGVAERYFAAGKQYRLTFGGGEAGSVAVKGSQEGCNQFHANVEVKTSASIRGRVMGLATDAAAPGRGAVSRRAPEAGERAAVLALVKSIYSQKGVSDSLQRTMQVTNLTATDLDGDGRLEMVGSFVVETKQKARRDLFLIAAPQGAGFRADFVNFQAYQLPSEGFDSAIDFVDQLDMDGDGVGEVVGFQHGFDGYGYVIYKRQRGRWRSAHTALGDAC